MDTYRQARHFARKPLTEPVQCSQRPLRTYRSDNRPAIFTHVEQSKHHTIELLGRECEIIEATFGTARFEKHFHDVFSIGLVAKGVNDFTYRGKRVEAPAGTICIADAGEVHDGGLAGASWAYRNIFVAPQLLNKLWQEDGGQRTPNFNRSMVDEASVCQAMTRLFGVLLNSSDQAARDEAAILAFGTLLRQFGTESVRFQRTKVKPLAAQAVEIIMDTKGASLSLGDLSRETGVSRYSVIRAVSGATGLTPTALMLQTRVDYAKKLVRSGVGLANAAVDAGFSDQAHLTREMKKRWGVTPGKLKPAILS